MPKVIGVDGSPRVPSSEISEEEDRVGCYEHLDALFPFIPLIEMQQKIKKKNSWTLYIPRVVCTLLHIEGSADCTIKIWDLSSARLKGTLTDHDEQVGGLAVSSRNAYMFSVGDDKQVKCWDIEQNKVIHSFRGHYALAFDGTGTRLISCEADKTIKIWKQDEIATPEIRVFNIGC
ncbi:Pleiotropic regulator 1 [Capsicum chinense]|nr:Pleiotropic regulator 1 [Capsicum chinense]